MKRTQKLMTTIATTLALGGGAAIPARLALAQNSTAQDDAWKTDPEVAKAADRVFEYLKTNPKSTQDEIQKRFADLQSPMLSNALKRLVYDGKVAKSGEGDATIYFPRTSGSGG